MLDRILSLIAEKLSLIGTNYSASANVNITSTNVNTLAHGASLTLPAGTYIIRAQAGFPTVSGSRNINIRLGPTDAEWAFQRVVSAEGLWAGLEATHIRALTAQTTVYCSVSSSKTVNAVQTKIEAVRIK
jgi:hypothetical protein